MQLIATYANNCRLLIAGYRRHTVGYWTKMQLVASHADSCKRPGTEGGGSILPVRCGIAAVSVSPSGSQCEGYIIFRTGFGFLSCTYPYTAGRSYRHPQAVNPQIFRASLQRRACCAARIVYVRSRLRGRGVGRRRRPRLDHRRDRRPHPMLVETPRQSGSYPAGETRKRRRCHWRPANAGGSGTYPSQSNRSHQSS
jgi:hypothetical protein